MHLYPSYKRIKADAARIKAVKQSILKTIKSPPKPVVYGSGRGGPAGGGEGPAGEFFAMYAMRNHSLVPANATGNILMESIAVLMTTG